MRPAVVLLLTLVLATDAQAQCDVGGRYRPADAAGAPLALGDSVMLAAKSQLVAAGFEVDARTCRRFDQGLAILAERELPELVVIALGSNAGVARGQLERALALVGPAGRLVLVLPRQTGGSADPDGDLMTEFAAGYPDRVTVLDWPGASRGHDEWFAGDGLHLSASGARAFADLITDGLDTAAESPHPLEPPPDEQPLEPEPEVAAEPPPAPLVIAFWRGLGELVDAAVTGMRRLLSPLLVR